RSADPEQVRQWWTKYPDGMPALVPGDGGLAALDVDTATAAGATQVAGISINQGLIVLTGGTSAPFDYEGATWPPRHVYVQAHEAPRIDGVVVRYLAGYVIAPGARRGERLYRIETFGEPAYWTKKAETR